MMYGNYAAQPEIGFLDRREGILGTARFKLTPNWVLLGAARYDLQAHTGQPDPDRCRLYR